MLNEWITAVCVRVFVVWILLSSHFCPEVTVTHCAVVAVGSDLYWGHGLQIRPRLCYQSSSHSWWDATMHKTVCTYTFLLFKLTFKYAFFFTSDFIYFQTITKQVDDFCESYLCTHNTNCSCSAHKKRFNMLWYNAMLHCWCWTIAFMCKAHTFTKLNSVQVWTTLSLWTYFLKKVQFTLKEQIDDNQTEEKQFICLICDIVKDTKQGLSHSDFFFLQNFLFLILTNLTQTWLHYKDRDQNGKSIYSKWPANIGGFEYGCMIWIFN